MKKYLIITLLSACVLNLNIQSTSFVEGFSWGTLTGLASGLITSKLAAPRQSPVYIMESPNISCQRANIQHQQYHINQQQQQINSQLQYNRNIELNSQARIKEMQIKEKQLELDLIRERKQLINAENRKIELELQKKKVLKNKYK